MDVCGFVPNIRCPHCNKHLRIQFTGYGRTGINSRERTCPGCDKEFWVLVYVETSKEGVEDAEISDLKGRLSRLRKQIRNHAERLSMTLESEILIFKGYLN